MRKSKDWLAQNQNNVSEWSDTSTRGLLEGGRREGGREGLLFNTNSAIFSYITGRTSKFSMR
jgi:hypothetical protein